MLLTNEMIEQGRSRNGGWSLDQFRLLGFDSFPQKGWKKVLIGKEIEPEIIKQFIELKDKHLNYDYYPYQTSLGQRCLER